jgi:hypothetical protein
MVLTISLLTMKAAFSLYATVQNTFRINSSHKQSTQTTRLTKYKHSVIYLTAQHATVHYNKLERLLATNFVSVESNEAPVVQSTNEEGYYHEITDDEQAVYDEINMDYQQARDVQAVAADHSVVSQQYQYEELNLQPTIVNKDRHSK